MLIDQFAEHCLDELHARAQALSLPNRLYLLIDGAFVPGLHKLIEPGEKILLFENLPGPTDEALDVSPFVTAFDSGNRRLKSLLHRCSGWPMLHAIESPEELETLAARLAAWCVIEADGQCFNFRFADTRRFPAIARTFSPIQRMQFFGPSAAWMYIARDGRWQTIAIDGCPGEPATAPSLDPNQFAALVDDSRVDEVLALLDERPALPLSTPSVEHAFVSEAITVAMKANVPEHELRNWCGWLWRRQGAMAEMDLTALFDSWRDQFYREETV